MIRGMESEKGDSAYQARRAAHLARLTDHGVPRSTAEWCVEQWERESEARGRGHDSEAFWEGAEDWIVKHRRR